MSLRAVQAKHARRRFLRDARERALISPMPLSSGIPTPNASTAEDFKVHALRTQAQLAAPIGSSPTFIENWACVRHREASHQMNVTVPRPMVESHH